MVTTYIAHPPTEQQNMRRSFRAPLRRRLEELLAAGTVPTDEQDLRILGVAAEFDDEAAAIFDRYLEAERERLAMERMMA